MLLNRDELLKDRRKTVDVDFPELGGKVRLKEMTVAQGNDLLAEIQDETKVNKAIMKAFVISAVDEDGKPAFLPGDEDLLSNALPMHVFGQITEAVLANAKLSAKSVNEVVDAAEKNSGTVSGIDSASA